jgi:hypothetical protein
VRYCIAAQNAMGSSVGQWMGSLRLVCLRDWGFARLAG